MHRIAHSILVIFGITGDLAKRKLLPALYGLSRENLLPEGFRIIGVSRRGTTNRDILDILEKASAPESTENTSDPEREAAIRRIGNALRIIDMDIGKTDSYGVLADTLAQADRDSGRPMNRLFYLAIPASLFPTVTARLAEPDINTRETGVRESRFLIEKPFGQDLASAQALIDQLGQSFDEAQLFRIDHYLAKETAQNILAFRFQNPLFRGIWNRKHISHILITASEKIGIEGRTAFYDHMGAMRDLVQSHLLQLLALVTMDEPAVMDSRHIHREKEALLSRIQPPTPDKMAERTVRGQYRSYRDETGIPDSKTDTYAALWLEIDTETWRDVPVLIRTGKALARKVTEITLIFADEAPGSANRTGRRNCLTLRIQPDEGIAVDFAIRKPGFEDTVEQVQLDYCYRGLEEPVRSDAYRRVLFDALRGDATLFATDREVLECWRISEPVLNAWKEDRVPLEFYDNGAAGPAGADELAGRAGTEWLPETHTVCRFPQRR